MRFFRAATLCVLLLAPFIAAVAQTDTGAVPIDAATRKAIIESIAEKMKAEYVFSAVADKVAGALNANVAAHAYDRDATAGMFAKALTHDLQSSLQAIHRREPGIHEHSYHALLRQPAQQGLIAPSPTDGGEHEHGRASHRQG